MADHSPTGLGPFIIMKYIENFSDLVDALNTPGLPDDDFHAEWVTSHRPFTFNMIELCNLEISLHFYLCT